MNSIINIIYNNIPERNEISKQYILVNNLTIPLFVLIIYVAFVKYWGPKFMENRKPYDLRNTILVYNVFQVVINAYIFNEALAYGWLTKLSWFKCNPYNPLYSLETERTVQFAYLYYAVKYTELLDTVFFVLRKKFNQASFLHVYHHGSMIIFTILPARYSPGGSITFIIFLNSFVHVIMYGYYLLAALGPRIQKYLWWKKYLTSIQLTQFVILFIHFVIVCFSDCNIPKFIAYIFTGNIIFNFILFFKFYRVSYTKPGSNKTLKIVQGKSN